MFWKKNILKNVDPEREAWRKKEQVKEMKKKKKKNKKKKLYKYKKNKKKKRQKKKNKMEFSTSKVIKLS